MDPEAQRPEVQAWNQFVDALKTAGSQVATDTAELPEPERADGFRALLRAVSNQLGRLEVDRERPELVAFNTWRQKFFMDNPDFHYWVADIRAGDGYRIRGNRGDAAYVSITVYSGDFTAAQAAARTDSDAMTFDEDGNYEVVLGGDPQSTGDRLDLPGQATAVWVRHFHDAVRTDRPGRCVIDPLSAPPVPEPIDPARFSRQLSKAAKAATFVPHVWKAARADDEAAPNQLRHWTEMASGAAYTEPDIHYLRGGWKLTTGEGLLIEGDLVDCRYWNILAYSRFLNSLDHRYRDVSYTGSTATIVDRRYRFIAAATDPGVAGLDWIDTEGREFGIVVMRFLQPARTPEAPTARLVRLSEFQAPT